MKTYHGVLKRVDLGAGGWQLVCSDGAIYDLYGDIPSELQNQTVKVQASTTAGAGFLMGGNVSLMVSKIEKSL